MRTHINPGAHTSFITELQTAWSPRVPLMPANPFLHLATVLTPHPQPCHLPRVDESHLHHTETFNQPDL